MSSKSNSDEQKVLRAFYERRHPAYADLLQQWKFLQATYNGGRQWFENNIFQYIKEGEKEYSDRVQRAYRFNHTREVVQLVQKYLSKADIHRNEQNASSSVKSFWENATLKGADIDELLSEISIATAINGRVAVVVDNNFARPKPGGRPLSIKEMKEAGGRVYSYIVSAPDVLDYAFDEDGDGGLLWVKLREIYRADTDPIYDDGATYERVRLWTRTDSTLFVKKQGEDEDDVLIEMVDHFEHNLGMVPVILADHGVSDDPYRVPGLIDDIAYLDRTVANYLSNLDAIIQDQTFSQLVIPAGSLASNDQVSKELVKMGTNRIFTYDGGSGSSQKPEFISPDPKQAKVILDTVNKIISEIYHTVGLAGERTKQDNAVGIDNSSGVAKAYDFERVNSLLLAKAQRCEAVENKMVRIVQAWMGENPKPDQKLVSYPKSFDVVRLTDDLVTSEALAKIEAPKEIRRRHMKVLAEKLFPQMSEKEKKQIMAGVDKWLDEIVDSQNAPKTKPGSQTVASPKRQGSVTSETPVDDKAKS